MSLYDCQLSPDLADCLSCHDQFAHGASGWNDGYGFFGACR